MITVEQSHKMNEFELEKEIFRGAGIYDPRGLRETLGDDVVSHLGESPLWHSFSPGFRAWIYSSWDEITEEFLASL